MSGARRWPRRWGDLHTGDMDLRRHVLFCSAVCLLAACGEPASSSPTMEERLQHAVDDFLDVRDVPGASVAVIDAGQRVQVVSGLADIDSQRRVSVETRFRVASVTKMYIATIALKLAERGVVSLDEPIQGHAVALPGGLEFARNVTLRQLLSHTTGLAQTFTRDEDRHSRLTIQDRLERIPRPVCDPGKCWSYADGNYVIAQLVLETLTGRSLAELFRDELIKPSALPHTELVNAASRDDLPPQYALATDEAGRPTVPHRLFEQALPLYETLVMTAGDAAQFADQLFSGEVLQPAQLEAMVDTTTMRDLPCPDGCPFKYGLGVFDYKALSGHDFIGHDGSSGTIVVHDAERDLTIAILTNGGETDMGAFLDAVVEAVEDSPA